MKILVTGGSGFIGSNFVRYMLHKGHTVFNLDCHTYAAVPVSLMEDVLVNQKNYFHILCDIRERVAVTGALQAIKPEVVVNMAAETHVDNSILNPSVFIETNVLGTKNLLEGVLWARDKQQIKMRFLHVSTDEVYGQLDLEDSETHWTESSPYAPRSPYAASKAASDHLVQAFHETYGLDTVTTHCCNNYGHFQNPEKFIPKIIMNIMNGKKVPVYGKGSNIREWIHVHDHCRAIGLLTTEGYNGYHYNIGDTNSLSNIELVRMILREMAVNEPEEHIEFVEDRLGHDQRYSLDSKFISYLGWKPRINFLEGLKDTISWYLNNGRYWNKKI